MKEKKTKRLRAREVAELYGVGLSTVWKYARDGYLTPIKVSKGITVFYVDEVEKLFSHKEPSHA